MKHRYFLNNIYIGLIIILFFTAKTGFAQEKNKKIFLIARPTKDSIMLRWAPNNYETWRLGNTYGYKLIRYTIMRDSTLLSEALKKDLVPMGIKAMSLDSWENLVKTNKYAAITAQAIFGESFEVNVGENITPESVVNMEKEQKQRFSFALYAADASPEVAKYSGLWFTDKSAKKNEMYLYRVFLNSPDSITLKRDTAFVFTGINDYVSLPAPVEVDVEFSDKTAMVKWNSFAQNNIYTSWQVQKSDNNKHFKIINTNSIVQLTQLKEETPEYSYKSDSLLENNKTYYYRIRGITPFGEYGPWSKTVSGKGENKLHTTPHINKYFVEENKVKLTWTFDNKEEKNIDEFKILRSYNDKIGFEEIHTVKATKRSFIDKKPLGTNYYKIVAYKTNKNKTESFPCLVQLKDNNPPKKPKGLSGTVDSTYIAFIKWKRNTDSDILGYKLFRSMSGNDEFSLVSSKLISDTCYIDTLHKNNLNRHVFYKLMAIDLRQNQSELSDIVELIQPDLIPPSIPVISNIETLTGGIKISWINSSSEDVDKYELYRLEGNDTLKVKIAEIPHKKGQKESFYIDKECSKDNYNRYIIMAFDKSRNRSSSELSISIKPLENKINSALKQINYKIDEKKLKIHLNWQLPTKKVKYIKIYRKINQGNYTLYDTEGGDKTYFEDSGMHQGNTYSYSIKLVYRDNSISPFSKETIVEF